MTPTPPRRRGVEPVDVVEVTDVPGPWPDPEVIEGRPPSDHPGLNRWNWWRSADRATRALAAVAVGAALIAVAAGADARFRPTTVKTVTRIVQRPAAVISVDATGCPADRRCTVGPTSASARDALGVLLPDAELVAATDTMDEVDRRVYVRVAVLRQATVTIRLVTQCVPGAAAVVPVGMSESLTRVIDTSTLPDGEAKLVGDRTVSERSTTRAGLTGCSATLFFTDTDTAAAHPHRIRAAVVGQLLADPRVVLSP